MKHRQPLYTIFLGGILLALSTTVLGQGQHLIGNTVKRHKVEEAFKAKLQLTGQQFYDLQGRTTSIEEEEALEFLYAYMPLADVTDYPTTFYLDNVRSTLRAREETTWGKRVPELLFLHFVLPLRVNNEALDTFRTTCYADLRQRVAGMSMADAILEVNHWCHERVTYQPSDGRTSSPLATIRSAYGRCGEESTLTVAALRAVGIPARQVYTPRWAHTDDNHAWVEAWADGEWHFLGACEPEPVLDLGWFNAPASRAMLMHTRVFGDYDGPEEVMLRTSNFTEINLIDNYANTSRIDFLVTDADGRPVENAQVDFKIYNYAEYCTVATKYTDASGRTFLTAGNGDMMVWASHEGNYGYAKASFGTDCQVTITLSHHAASDLQQGVFPVENYDIVPPAQHVRMPEVSTEQRARNTQRLAYEDSIRHHYMSTFLDDVRARSLAQSHGLEADSVASLLVKSRGNHPTILQFLVRHRDQPDRALALLRSLRDKDLRDMPTAILEDHFGATSDQLCPRVENEMIILPFKQELQHAFDAATVQQMRHDPSLLVRWVRDNIRMNPDSRSLRIAQTPLGVWRSRVSDSRSRDIFFVDLARSLGIAARKDHVTGKVQYQSADSTWTDVEFGTTPPQTTPTGTLIIRYQSNPIVDDPKYFTHFTITRIDEGKTQLLNFEEGQVDMGEGVNWSSTFKQGTPLDVGTYELVTGTRLASGSVLSSSQIFTIRAGATTTLDMALRYSDDEVSVIGSFDSESKYTTPDGRETSILSQTGRGYYAIGVIGMGQEPTNHALRDISRAREQFETWGRPLLLLFENADAMLKFHESDYGKMPSTVIYGIDTDGRIRQQMAKAMKMEQSGQLPIFLIADTFNRVVFQSQGYTIGLGDQMGKVAKSLGE